MLKPLQSMRRAWLKLAISGLAPILLGVDALAQGKFKDPLDYPAQMQSAITERPLMSIAKAGDRLVAVGSRGLIIVSTNGGKSWTQSTVPVQSDLLAVHFPTPTKGWAVGHDGVVLASDDGGLSWRRQLDGRIAMQAFTKYYQPQVTEGDPVAKVSQAQIGKNLKAGPSLPYLDVWFDDSQRGYAVGSFGMIIATSDGGKSWEPWLSRIDNEQFMNLNAIRGINGEVYIAGERGLVFRLDRAKARFTKMETGYAGSFFGITGSDKVLLAYGLRGVVYMSNNHGTSWARIKMPSEATISSGVLVPGDGHFILVNGAGQALLSGPEGQDFKLIPFSNPIRSTGVALLSDDTLVLTSTTGIRRQAIPMSFQ